MDTGFDWIDRYGYLGIFLLLMLGIVGLPVPDETLLMFAGYLSYKGDLHAGPALCAAFLGTSCGITLSYGIGRWAGLQALTRIGLFFHVRPLQVAQAQAWVRYWGPYALPVAYFLPGLRHVAAIVVGASRLPVSRFSLFAYAGALLWSGTFIGLGYSFGAEWRRLSSSVHHSLLIAAILGGLALALAIALFYRRSVKRQTETS
jgi:membrane protein DedA with SNARE-associated domain